MSAPRHCKHCWQPCHVVRVSPGGMKVAMATCPDGMAIDRAICGHDHRTLIDPRTGRPEIVSGSYRVRRASAALVIGAVLTAVGRAICGGGR